MPPPGLGEGWEGEGGGLGVSVRPLEVEEAVLEAVGGDLLGVDFPPGLHQAPLAQVLQHPCQGRALVRDDQLVQVHHHQILDFLHVPDNDVEGLRYTQARVQLTCTDSRSEQQRGPQS